MSAQVLIRARVLEIAVVLVCFFSLLFFGFWDESNFLLGLTLGLWLVEFALIVIDSDGVSLFWPWQAGN